MARSFVPIAVVGVLGLGSLAVAAWSFSVDTSPDVVVSAPVASTVTTLPEPAAPVRPARKRPGRPAGRAERPERPVHEETDLHPELRDWELPPDERAMARNQFRQERLSDLDARLDLHAEQAGWDVDTTEEVRAVLIGTSGKITDTLARVDAGEVAWEGIRDDLRDFRLQQARDVREILGPEGFDDFVVDMGFERFPDGEKPVHGRLDEPPKRPPKRARGKKGPPPQ